MLDLIWAAQFKDGNTIVQYEDPKTQQIEHTFKEVLDKQDELEKFALLSVNTNAGYVVNLKNGTMGVTTSESGEIEPDEDMLRAESYRYRLIYFRRVYRDFSYDLRDLKTTRVLYFMGFQYNDKDNKNHKRLMKINSDGRLIIN